jgi:hypothetical protein
MRNLPVDDEAHLLLLCPATGVIRRERCLTQLPFASLLMCCPVVYGVALSVHKCLNVTDAAAEAAARQAPR